MKKTAQARVRARIRARLDELGMTARELAAATGHKDAWISGILSGYQSLSWDDFDSVADRLGLAPSELVRYDDATVRELTPREMRLLKHYQDWPPEMQDRWLAMLDFFAASVPDKDLATVVDRLRALPRGMRRSVLGWLYRILEEGFPPEALSDAGSLSGAGAPDATTKPRQGRLPKNTRTYRRENPPTTPGGPPSKPPR